MNQIEKCDLCDSKIDLDSGDINGYFGICPVSFCVWCLSSITDMVIQMQGFDDIETLEQRINEIKEDQDYDTPKQSKRK